MVKLNRRKNLNTKEYMRAIEAKPGSRLNVIIAAVNAGTPKIELEMDEAESMFYDRLEKQAKRYEAALGWRPVYEMCEIEWDDPALDIYQDSVENMDAKIEEERNGATLVEVPRWVKDEPDEYMTAIMTFVFKWEMFGMQKSVTVDDLMLDRDGWSRKDAEYVYAKLAEHGYV